MGLGLYFSATRREPTTSISSLTFDSLARAFWDCVADADLRRLVTCREHEDRLYVSLHPAEEEIEFWRDADRLLVSAKTSSCGPGYHAYLVEILTAMGQALGLDWITDGEDWCDETGYWEYRDFGRLRGEMLAWLQAVCANMPDDDASNQMICMPIGFPIPVNNRNGALTPLGFRSASWFASVAADARGEQAGEAFFPWWNKPLDGLFWKRYGLVHCWSTLRWNAPCTDEEREQYETVLRCFALARRAEPTIALPEVEIAEINALLADDAGWREEIASDVTRIGYYRHILRHQLTGGWGIELPGYFCQNYEDDGSVAVYSITGFTVRATSYRYSGGDGSTTARERVGDADELEQGEELVDDLDQDPPGWAKIAFRNESDGDYWVLQGRKGHPNGICAVTICYDNAQDRDRAVRTWRSLTHVRPAE